MITKITSDRIPYQFPYAFRVTDNFIGCLVWCRENIGPILEKGKDGDWFESNGIFFFKKKSDSLRFRLGMGCNIKNENVVHSYIDKLYEEFV